MSLNSRTDLESLASHRATYEGHQFLMFHERGTTRLVVDTEGISRITPEELAIAAIGELENPHRGPHFTVAQAQRR